MNWFTQAARDSLAEMAVINLINLPVSLGVGYYLSASALAVFGFIVLLEATALMFIGGAMDLEHERRLGGSGQAPEAEARQGAGQREREEEEVPAGGRVRHDGCVPTSQSRWFLRCLMSEAKKERRSLANLRLSHRKHDSYETQNYCDC